SSSGRGWRRAGSGRARVGSRGGGWGLARGRGDRRRSSSPPEHAAHDDAALDGLVHVRGGRRRRWPAAGFPPVAIVVRSLVVGRVFRNLRLVEGLLLSGDVDAHQVPAAAARRGAPPRHAPGAGGPQAWEG
ncbi:unnamed protein product, partial [Scytosiphon promiscuus]